MLGKLIKYDFKSTSRVMWILYLALIVVGALLGLTFRFSWSDNHPLNSLGLAYDDSGVMEVLTGTLGTIFFLLIQAVGIVTVVMVIMRFYKNLLGDEGYLMHTLPVKTGELIASKLIISFVWFVFAGIAGFLAILAFLSLSGLMMDILQAITWEEFVNSLSYIFSGTGILTMIFAVTSIVAFITQCYASMAIGNLANKNKILFSVLAYLGIGVVTSIATSIIGVTSGGLLNWIFYDETLNKVLIAGIGVQLVLTTAYIIITNFILKNRLNLA